VEDLIYFGGVRGVHVLEVDGDSMFLNGDLAVVKKFDLFGDGMAGGSEGLEFVVVASFASEEGLSDGA
jgi:hypothetical protein